MDPSERLARIKEMQEDAARLEHRINRLRLRELRNWFMTGAEIKERRRLEREDEKDLAEQRQGDWTR
jgi:hypothetical protein